jgi:hypothetical protein
LERDLYLEYATSIHKYRLLSRIGKLYSKSARVREGPSPHGARSVPPFCISFLKKRLELKSLKERTMAEALRPRGPQLLNLRPPLKAL